MNKLVELSKELEKRELAGRIGMSLCKEVLGQLDRPKYELTPLKIKGMKVQLKRAIEWLEEEEQEITELEH